MKLKTFTTHDIDDLSKTGVYSIKNQINNKYYIGSAAHLGTCPSSTGFWCRWLIHVQDLRANRHHSKYLQRSWNKYGEEAFDFSILEFVEPEKCIEREQSYLDTADLKMIYNTCLIAGSTLGFRHSQETIDSLSKSYLLYSPEGDLIEGKNLWEFCRQNNLSRSSLHKVFVGKQLHHKGFTRSYRDFLIYKEAYEMRAIHKRSSGSYALVNGAKHLATYNTLELAKFSRDLLEVILDKKFNALTRGKINAQEDS